VPSRPVVREGMSMWGFLQLVWKALNRVFGGDPPQPGPTVIIVQPPATTHRESDVVDRSKPEDRLGASTGVSQVPDKTRGFEGFTKWPFTAGSIAAAGKRRVNLNRVKGVTDTDWELLQHLWFWQITPGDQTHTFGYKRDELPGQFREPLARWIAHATARGGTGAEERMNSVGPVVRVNIPTNASSEISG
jgi:transglutaminase-like putative cysteine protease